MFEGFWGNQAVTHALEQMIRQGRLAQTLLFSGAEGVGKATLARRIGAELLGHPELIERDDLSLPDNVQALATREKLAAEKRNDDPLMLATHPDFVTFPPDDSFMARVGASEVQTYFTAMGSRQASTYSATSPHPYMQKTRTLDLCLVLEGEITLVLDTQEVQLKAGDTIVQRGTNHAWSNRSSKPCTIAFSIHDAR